MQSVAPPPNPPGRRGLRLFQVLRYRDFRLLWIGAFVSFTGSWIQNVAQGHFVFSITGDEAKLAMVNTVWSMPVFLFGMFAGMVADRFNRRTVLVWCQALLGLFALGLGIATYRGLASYELMLGIAMLNGLVATVEMPARQSVVSRVVPPEELSAAVPVNALTFNAARILGPVVGGALLATVGVSACFIINGVSYLALIGAVMAIRADLRTQMPETGSIRLLVTEGARFTLREPRLRTLFFLEGVTTLCGLAYLPLLPAYVAQMNTSGDRASLLGWVMATVGTGAVVGLLITSQLADWPNRGRLIQGAMAAISIGLLVASLTSHAPVAFLALGVVGMGTMIQLNTTNALFQTLSPDRLRARTLAMHIWVLNGLSPFGALFFGWVASQSRQHGAGLYPYAGVRLTFQIEAALMALGTAGALLAWKYLKNVSPAPDLDAGAGDITA